MKKSALVPFILVPLGFVLSVVIFGAGLYSVFAVVAWDWHWPTRVGDLVPIARFLFIAIWIPGTVGVLGIAAVAMDEVLK